MLNILVKAKWLLGGNFIFAFSQWLILIMLARLGDNVILGNYALALAIVSPVFAIFNLQLRPLYILDANSIKKYTYANFYYLRLLSSFFAFFTCLIVSLYYSVSIFVLMLVAFLKLLESYSDIIYAYYNAYDKTQLISKSLILKSILSLLGVYLGLVYFNFYIALMIFVAAYFSVWIFLDNSYIRRTKELKFTKIDFSIMKIAIPMGISLGVVTLQGNIPRLFLDKYVSIEKVGVFTILSYFIIIGSIFINSICQYLSPRLTRAWNDDIVFFKKILCSMLALSFILGIVAIVFSKYLGGYFLLFFYGEKYLIYENELNKVMIAGLFLYLSTVIGYTLTSVGFIKNQVYLFSFILVCGLLFSSYFIPLYGLNGAIFTLILSYIVQFFTGLFILLKLIKGKSA